jgi:hypothetical protein
MEKLKLTIIKTQGVDNNGEVNDALNYSCPPDNLVLMEKINEIIDYLNKPQEVKFNPEQASDMFLDNPPTQL